MWFFHFSINYVCYYSLLAKVKNACGRIGIFFLLHCNTGGWVHINIRLLHFTWFMCNICHIRSIALEKRIKLIINMCFLFRFHKCMIWISGNTPGKRSGLKITSFGHNSRNLVTTGLLGFHQVCFFRVPIPQPRFLLDIHGWIIESRVRKSL